MSRQDIADWFDRGVDNGNGWMVVVTDGFDNEDYPSYHTTEESARKVAREPGAMQRAVEVYKLDPRYKQYQINMRCCWAFNIDFTAETKEGAS